MIESVEIKKCSGCRKSHTEQGKNCLPCKEKSHTWYLNNKERHAENGRKYRERDPERFKALSRERTKRYCRRHPERIRQANRIQKLRTEFGISVHEYEEMNIRQGGLCAICKQTNASGKRLGVDHDHKTGKIRELLCSLCNTAIGELREDPDILRAAIAYLEKHK